MTRPILCMLTIKSHMRLLSCAGSPKSSVFASAISNDNELYIGSDNYKGMNNFSFNYCFMNTFRASKRLDPDQVQYFVGPKLGPS